MTSKCHLCTAEKRACTDEEIKAALEEPQPIHGCGVVEDGKFRKFTPEEEDEVRIKRISQHEGPIVGTHNLYGRPDCCHLKLVIRLREPVQPIQPAT